MKTAAKIAVKEAVDEAFSDIRTELASIKHASRDSEVVVRQSLANILFLIDKFGKELQFHAFEERIAGNERDLRLARSKHEDQPLPVAHDRKSSLLSNAVAFYRRL